MMGARTAQGLWRCGGLVAGGKKMAKRAYPKQQTASLDRFCSLPGAAGSASCVNLNWRVTGLRQVRKRGAWRWKNGRRRYGGRVAADSEFSIRYTARLGFVFRPTGSRSGRDPWCLCPSVFLRVGDRNLHCLPLQLEFFL